jgi:predicted DNA-binding transcriptional regulator AlpA
MPSMHTAVTVAAVGALLGYHRGHAWRLMKAGEFGPPIKLPGRPAVVPIAAVEKVAGRKFTPKEIDAALLAATTKRIAHREAELATFVKSLQKKSKA